MASPCRLETASKPEIIAFTQQRIGCSHVTARNHGAPPDCHQVNDHEHDEKDRQQNERNHDRPGFDERLQDGLANAGEPEGARFLRKHRRRARQRGKQHRPKSSCQKFGNDMQSRSADAMYARQVILPASLELALASNPRRQDCLRHSTAHSKIYAPVEYSDRARRNCGGRAM